MEFVAAESNAEFVAFDKSTILEQSVTMETSTSQLLAEKKESGDFNAVNIPVQPELDLPQVTTDVNHPRQCACHMTDAADERVKPFTDRSWKKVLKYVSIHKNHDGFERVIAAEFRPSTAVSQGYHTSCYKLFTDNSRVRQAFKRLLDMGQQASRKSDSRKNCHKTAVHSRYATKGTRMFCGIRIQPRPSDCIFCHIEQYRSFPGTTVKKLVNLQCWGSHDPDNKMLARLRQAAEQRKDEELLELLRRVDGEPGFVLKGHSTCHYKYMRQVEPKKSVGRPTANVAEFEQFCTDVIEKRIIEGGEMLTRHELTKMFMKSIEASDQIFSSLSKILLLRIKKQYGDQVTFIHVNGVNSHFLVSKKRLQQILADANSLQEVEDVRSDILLKQSATVENTVVDTGTPYRCIACHNSFGSCEELDLHRSENSSCSTQYVEMIGHAADFGIDLSAITHIPNLQRYKCKTCLRCYNTADLLQQHEKVHKVSEKCVLELYTCKMCGKWFRELEQFDTHMEKVHEDNATTSHRCRHCDMEFSKIGDMREHIRSCDQAVIFYYMCQYCNKQFCKPTLLKMHTMRYHILNGAKFVACEHCNRIFTSRSLRAFEEHLKSHSSEKAVMPFCCEICGKLLSTSQKLKAHMEFHADIKSYLCEFCSKLFRDVTYLNKHTAFHHSQTRPYICQDCGKGFTHASSLKYHSFCHSGLKPFKCTVCSKCFGTRSLLRQHMRSHTKPYCCEACCKRFAHSWTFKAHMATHQEDMTNCNADEVEKDDMTHCEVGESQNFSVITGFFADSDAVSVCGEVELPFSSVDGTETFISGL